MTNPKKTSLEAKSTETTKIKQDETESARDQLIKPTPKSEIANAEGDTTNPNPITTTKDKEGDVRPGFEKEKNLKKKS
ncbi:hypothetical protein KORDIASMS9_04673 [Kordia sp. SMS9]|uniref:hypothetical protein n=1 Tax=Kordia sp. SMS9 TaxID=2282170 RepID=UPI000E0E00F6|nr:hypothetical protein [Kordia sp. SMS9]AXG72401.1 hypothetical protein KORDIASMS9_04673 [Kordia sp. SMS9]